MVFMDKKIYAMHANMCKVFTSPARIEILDLLRGGRKSVSELVELSGLRQPNVSQHLQLMREKSVVTTEKEGNAVFYSIANPKMSKAFEIMKEMLMDKLAEAEMTYKTVAKSRK